MVLKRMNDYNKYFIDRTLGTLTSSVWEGECFKESRIILIYLALVIGYVSGDIK